MWDSSVDYTMIIYDKCGLYNFMGSFKRKHVLFPKISLAGLISLTSFIVMLLHRGKSSCWLRFSHPHALR